MKKMKQVIAVFLCLFAVALTPMNIVKASPNVQLHVYGNQKYYEIQGYGYEIGVGNPANLNDGGTPWQLAPNKTLNFFINIERLSGNYDVQITNLSTHQTNTYTSGQGYYTISLPGGPTGTSYVIWLKARQNTNYLFLRGWGASIN